MTDTLDSTITLGMYEYEVEADYRVEMFKNEHGADADGNRGRDDYTPVITFNSLMFYLLDEAGFERQIEVPTDGELFELLKETAKERITEKVTI